MNATSQQKGKLGELWVFSKLVEAGAHVYLPLVDDEGVDAIVRGSGKDGTLRDIQVKSTHAADQIGYFNIKFSQSPDFYSAFHVVCVNLSPMDGDGPQSEPEAWIFPVDVFIDHATKQKSREYRPALAATSREDGKPRREILWEYREAWHRLTD